MSDVNYLGKQSTKITLTEQHQQPLIDAAEARARAF